MAIAVQQFEDQPTSEQDSSQQKDIAYYTGDDGSYLNRKACNYLETCILDTKVALESFSQVKSSMIQLTQLP